MHSGVRSIKYEESKLDNRFGTFPDLSNQKLMNKLENLDYGKNTLNVISAANKFNRWMYERIKPYCTGDILEVGSGIGNISRFFLQDKASMVLSDLEEEYFSLLTERFSDNTNLKGIVQLDFSDPYLEKHHPEMIEKFDTVFALNVVEHIPDHYGALQNAGKLLKSGGKVIILVPAFNSLYNQFDVQLGHERRYTEKSLQSVLQDNGFEVIHSSYFNAIGILGWYFTGRILEKKEIPSGQMKFYDTLVPVWKIVDFFMSKLAGLSVIQVGQKP